MSTLPPKRLALVTGSTSGIGWSIAKALAQAGHNIVLNGFATPEKIKSCCAELQERYAVKACHKVANLAHPKEIESMVRDVSKELGTINILVNNAGIQHVSPIETFPTDRWDDIIAVNLSAVFHTTRCVLPGMRASSWGRIVNISSTHGLVASIHKAAYVSAKHAVLGLTKVTALETAHTGITANAICPGWVDTPLVQAQIVERAAREGLPIEKVSKHFLEEKQPSCAFVTPESIGQLVVFLCTDGASQVRGAAWTIDGGWTAQ